MIIDLILKFQAQARTNGFDPRFVLLSLDVYQKLLDEHNFFLTNKRLGYTAIEIYGMTVCVKSEFPQETIFLTEENP